jgi:hypothetical protein
MSNTIRDLSELLTLFADNNSNQITAQDLRDLIVTTDSWRFSGDYNDLYNMPSLGTLSSQNSNNVNISGGSLSNINNLQASQLSISGIINTGLNLAVNSFSTAKVSIRSPIVNLKQIAENEIFTVPDNFMFLIDSMEILTTSISGINNSLQARFGNNLNPEEYYSASQINNFNIGDRHIVEISQNAAIPGSTVTFGVVSGSSASFHEGAGIIHGSLIKIT